MSHPPLFVCTVWTLTLFCYSSYLFKFNVILNLVHIYVLGLSSVGIGVFISPFIEVLYYYYLDLHMNTILASLNGSFNK